MHVHKDLHLVILIVNQCMKTILNNILKLDPFRHHFAWLNCPCILLALFLFEVFAPFLWSICCLTSTNHFNDSLEVFLLIAEN